MRGWTLLQPCVIPCDMNTQTMGPQGIGAPTTVPAPGKVKYVLYARKSTESEEKQILSIDSQVKEMLQIAEREGLEIVDIRRESHSAKNSGERPVFAEILRDIRSGRYTGILTWNPDRLSRNAGDLGSLVDLMDQKLLIEIRTYGQRFINSPNEKFLLMILCSQAKLENDNKSVNVKRGLRTRVEMGLWPAQAPTGYLNEKRTDRKGSVILDPVRAPVVKQMFEKVAGGWSGRKLYHWLKFEINFRTNSGNKHLCLGNLYRLLQNSFYYGVFEYPAGSGNWYTGKHPPLISRETFLAAQEQLKQDHLYRNAEVKEFAFTKLFTCGLCGSSISAQEKFKKRKDGTVVKYIYYGCCRSKDTFCKNKYLREEELIPQLIELIGALDIDEPNIKRRFIEETKRVAKFQKSFLGARAVKQDDVAFDARTYAAYVLNDGNPAEKRELLAHIKSKFVVTNKIVSLRND